jgi:hypothetical protein
VRCRVRPWSSCGRDPDSVGRDAQGQLKNETFTLVGYGVDIGDKKSQIVVQERRSTTSFLKNVQNEVVVFQVNENDSKAGGGSCFGDSGGPVFSTGSCSATPPT